MMFVCFTIIEYEEKIKIKGKKILCITTELITDKAMTCYSHKMWLSLNTHTQHTFIFFSQYRSDFSQQFAFFYNEDGGSMLPRIITSLGTTKLHVSMSWNTSSKQSVNTNSQSSTICKIVKSVLLWSNMCVSTVPNCVFIKEYMEQQFKTNIPLTLQKAKQSALELTQATV
jgi:hypothetical protein